LCYSSFLGAEAFPLMLTAFLAYLSGGGSGFFVAESLCSNARVGANNCPESAPQQKAFSISHIFAALQSVSFVWSSYLVRIRYGVRMMSPTQAPHKIFFFGGVL